MHILIVEDSTPTRELLESTLGSAGHRVTTAARVSTGLRLATQEDFDVVVIDVMLPDGSGVELCAELRRRGVSTPILFLTAKGEVGDRIAGLDAGGDDYMRKPFAVAELLARVRALGRRRGLAPPARLAWGDTRVDFTARHLERGGEEVPLTAREWEVLETLAARAGRVVSRAEVLELVWHEATGSASESLDVIVSRLRRKLADASCSIRTVRGQGYCFERTR